MSFFQLNITRFLTVYIAQGIMCVYFAYLAFKILRRDSKRLNLIFSGFYICNVASLVINFIYAPITDQNIVLIMHIITTFFAFFSPIFILIFELMLQKPEKTINTKKQMMILIIYGSILLGMILFLFIEDWGINIGPPDWTPQWMLPFFIYLVAIVSILVVIPSFLLAYQIYRKFDDIYLKKKWEYFIIGLAAFYACAYGIFISNLLNIPLFRTIIGIVDIILIISGSYLMYIGVGRQLQ
ncbi:MAG: hypothetical protein ACFE9Z_09795 [Promethearchaeota archaeon]